MKKIFTTFVLSVCVLGASAQVKAPARHYINLSYAQQKLEFSAYESVPAITLKSDNSAAIEFGSTFFFNGKKPVLDMVRFGLDLSYLDLQYASYKVEGVNEDGEKIDAHFANIGMRVGPSVTVSPFEWLNAKAYIHYAPSFAAFSPDGFDDIKGGYAGYITGGVQASLKFVTLGVELRKATAKLSTFNPDNITIDDVDPGDIGGIGDIDLGADDLMGPKVDTKLPGVRFIVGFRF